MTRREREPDSVDALLGGAYSEGAIEGVRALGRPPWEEEDSSLDPVSDLEDFLEHGLALPPATHDALQGAVGAAVAALEAAKGQRLAPAAEARVRARRALAEGAPAEEVKWLKLKAYHRGVARLRQEAAADAADARSPAALAARGVPLDVPGAADLAAPPLEWLQRQLQKRGPAAGDGAAAAVAAAERATRGGLGAGSSGAGSGGGRRRAAPAADSEWDPSWEAAGYDARHPHVRAALREALGAAPAPAAPESPAAASSSSAAAAAKGGEGPAAALSGRPAGTVVRRGPQAGWQAVYTPAAARQRTLARRLDLQQRRGRQAFWGGLLAVLGASGLQWLMRRRRERGGGGGGSSEGGAAAPPSPAAAGKARPAAARPGAK